MTEGGCMDNSCLIRLIVVLCSTYDKAWCELFRVDRRQVINRPEQREIPGQEKRGETMPGKDIHWYKLDNAAKIIPSTAVGSDTRVFRLCCELKEEVDGGVLQAALDDAVREYPHFQCYLKKGLFWYYMEQSPEKAEVTEEKLPALSALYYPGRKTLLFRVNYYRRRINLEVYHVVSDGAGAFQFFRQIICNYLVQKHALLIGSDLENKGSFEEKADDAFRYYYTRKNKSRALKQIFGGKKPACQLRGTRDENLNIHLLEGVVSVRAFLDLCHAHHTTLALMTTAIMIEAVIREMRISERNRPVVVTVPVNLRNYFPTETTRNFYGVITISYHASAYDGTIDSILKVIQQSYEDQLKEDQIEKTMNTYSALERNWALKMVPLQLKDLGIQGFNYLRLREVTTSVSNVGRLTMPEQTVPYIDRFSAFMATQKGQMVVVSFEDKLAFGITSAFKRHDVMRNFFRSLVRLGLEVELATNDYDLI